MSDIRQWRTVLVYGLGVSGRAAVSLALARGHKVVATDDDTNLERGDLPGDVEVLLGAEEVPAGVDGLVVSPGVPDDAPLLRCAAELGLPVIAEVEFAYQWSDSGTFIGITGSNGKSTTTALAGEILALAGERVAVCGNFGVALSAAVQERADVYVVELSSFQLERVARFHARVAAWLNLSSDHLDRHGTLAGYAAAKERVFRNQSGDDVAILNQDDAVVSTTEVCARRLSFSCTRPVTAGCYLEQGLVLEVEDGHSWPLFSREELSLPGRHNLENAMAAGLIGRSMGVSRPTVQEAVRAFRGLPHRLELVAEIEGVRFFNDSKGTNAAASAHSLRSFPRDSVHLIVGGRAKSDRWLEMVSAARGRVKRAYGIGEAGPDLVKVLAAVTNAEQVGDLEKAVKAAADNAQAGDVVLLSPGCASYDQYQSFEHRGEHFRQLVHDLGGVRDG